MSKPNSQNTLDNFGYKQELKRTLPFRDVLIYGMIFMVPIAPMGVFGYVAKDANGMVPLVYLVGVCAMIFTALSYAKLSGKFPISGSVYAYVQRGLNPHIGFVAGWTILMDYIITPSLLYSMAGAWLASLTPGIPAWVWIVGFILTNTLINIRGIEITAKANMIMLAIELIALAIFIVVGLVFVLKGGGAGHLTIDPFYKPGEIDPKFLAMATSIAVLSFLGFDAISTLAEETTNAEKVVGRATITALVVMGSIFMLQTYVAAIVSPSVEGMNPDTAFFEIAGIAAGSWAKNMLIGVNIIAVGIANTMAAQAGISRILFSMSRDKYMPTILSKVHPKFKTPYMSTIFVAIFSVVVAISINIEFLITLVNFGALSSFMLLNFTVFWYFFVKEGNRGMKSIINYVIFPFVGLFIIGFVWWGFDAVTKMIGFSWMFIGVVIGAIKSKGYKEVPDAFKDVQF